MACTSRAGTHCVTGCGRDFASPGRDLHSHGTSPAVTATVSNREHAAGNRLYSELMSPKLGEAMNVVEGEVCDIPLAASSTPDS